MDTKPKKIVKTISDLGYVKKQPLPERNYKKPIKHVAKFIPQADTSQAIAKLRQLVRPLESPPRPPKGNAFCKNRLDNIVNVCMLRAIDSNIRLDQDYNDDQKEVVYRPIYRQAQPKPVDIQPVIPKVIQTPIVSRQIGGIVTKSIPPSSTESTPSKTEEPLKKVVKRTKKVVAKQE